MLLHLFQNAVILRRPGVANFENIIRIAIKLIKTTFKISIIVKGIPNYVLFLFIFFYADFVNISR